MPMTHFNMIHLRRDTPDLSYCKHNNFNTLVRVTCTAFNLTRKYVGEINIAVLKRVPVLHTDVTYNIGYFYLADLSFKEVKIEYIIGHHWACSALSDNPSGSGKCLS